MKKIVLSIMMLSLFTSIGWAQSFTTGYAALVVFTDGHSSRPAGEDESMCLENERQIIANYLGMFPPGDVAVDESRSLPCGPRTSPAVELDLAAWQALRIPPRCLSCPLLGPESFKIYYPGFEPEIKDLYFQFGIDQYNKELLKLQQKYNLQSFEKEVFHLNNEINLSKQ